MPITSELNNLKKLESVGFNHEQAEALADVIEKSHVDSQEGLKEFFRNELSKQIGSLDNKINGLESNLNNKINGLESKLNNKINGLESKLSNKINGLESNLSNKINGLDKEISSLRVEISKELKDLLIKIFGIVVGTVGLAVTILKLFP